MNIDQLADLVKRQQRMIDSLQGQVMALTLSIRPIVDKHPRAAEVLAMLHSETEQARVSLLNKPFQEGVLEGFETALRSLQGTLRQRPQDQKLPGS